MGIEKDKRQDTPTMTDILQKSVEKRLCEVYTSMPGSVVSYDIGTGLAVIQPLLQKKYKNESEPTTLPLIAGVPVTFPRMGGSRLRLPVAPGDEGEIRWMMRSIDVWQSTGGIVDPDDPRKFNFSDAIFQPGLFSQSSIPQLKGAATSAVLNNDRGFFEITPDGRFKLSNGALELLEEIEETFNIIGRATTNTFFGPMRLNEHPLILLQAKKVKKLRKP